MEKLQKLMNDIAEWSDSEFSGSTRSLPAAHHLKQEVDELIAALYAFHNSERKGGDKELNRLYSDVCFEFADCLMLLLDTARMVGCDADSLHDYCRASLKLIKLGGGASPMKTGLLGTCQ